MLGGMSESDTSSSSTASPTDTTDVPPSTSHGAGSPPGAGTHQSTAAPLRVSTVLAYSAPMVGINFSLVLFMSYINKYAIDVLLVPATAMGLIFGVGRLWDAVTDPMAGLWSDRTEHRWGRRRPWIAASSIPVALFGLMVWAPPESLGTPALIAWMTVAVFGFNTAMTIFLTPHQALGAELTADHHSVSRIFAFRQAAGYVGMIGCLVFAIEYLMTAEDRRGSAFELALIAGIVIIVVNTISVAVLREPTGNRRRGGGTSAGVARDVWKNSYARRLLIMIFIEHTGSGASMVVSPFLMQYVIKMPERIGDIFLFYVGSSLISLPLWLWLARTIGKKQAWLVGLSIGMVGYISLFFVGEGDLRWMQMVVSLTGACSACGTVIGSSMLADVIDADELETGERKEGAYYSAYTFLYKSSSGVMAMVTGFALTWTGFIPNAPHQTELVELALRSLNGLVPFTTMLLGAFILVRFTLTEEVHARIRAQLDARNAESSDSAA
jgi:GPH family glycoside/pentoside/hexuronide:cation symporter